MNTPSWIRRWLVFCLAGWLCMQSAVAATVSLTLDAFKDEYFPILSTEFIGQQHLAGSFTLNGDWTQILGYDFVSSGLPFAADVHWSSSDPNNPVASIFHDAARGVWAAFFMRRTAISIDNSPPNSQHLWIVWDDDTGSLVTSPRNGSPITEWYELGGPDRDYIRHGTVVSGYFSVPEPGIQALALIGIFTGGLASLPVRRRKS